MRYCLGLVASLAMASLLFLTSGVSAQSPGDTVGFMQFDNQSWASIGHKIAIDNAGGTHIVWHQSYPDSIEWNIKYAYIDNSGAKNYTDLGWGEFPQIAVNSVNQPGITFDHSDDWDMFYWTPEGTYLLPDIGMWPMVTIDRQDRVHIAYFWYGGGREGVRNIGYVRSDDNGQTWTEPVKVDSALTPSFMITSSPVSDKVAIVYSNNLTWEPVGVSYIQSTDGINWDWEGGEVDVTNYPPTPFVTGDDIDAVYDYNDNLHIVWNAQICYEYGNDDVYIRHYDAASGLTNVVATSLPWPTDIACMVGWWNGPICKMSIAVTTSSMLAVSYTRFDPKDCSLGGSADGEIFMNISSDQGQTWSVPMNLTHSWTPDCAAGDCNSDHWSSMAERINNYAHLFYVNDKDAGDREFGEGSSTVNPMLYFRIPIEESEVSDGSSPLPYGISLCQNYPNPFNSRTAIWYTLMTESNIRIGIYDISGRMIETLKEGSESAGSHAVTWDAGGLASGVYFCRLQAETGAQTRRMILLK